MRRLILLLALINTAGFAQVSFKKGNEFQRQVITKSNCVLQRGGQTLRVGSVSVVVKTYKVTDATAQNASVLISTDQVIDTINAMDQNLIYHSGRPADPNSPIQAGLQKMAAAQTTVSVNQKGEVLNVKRAVAISDTLLSFTGIQAERLSPGSTLPFMVNFPFNTVLKKGYSWTDTTPSAETVYTVYALNGRTTTITYKTTVQGGNLNSRINGTILIDNSNGMVLKRYAQGVSTGYEMVNGIVYTATRRTATTEVSVKKS